MEKPHLKKKPRRFCEHCSLELSHAQYYDHRRRYFRNGVWEKNLQRTRSDNAQILLSRHTGGRSVRPGAGETHEREMQTEHPGKEVKEEHEDNDETADDQNIHLFMDSSDSESVQDEDLSCHEVEKVVKEEQSEANPHIQDGEGHGSEKQQILLMKLLAMMLLSWQSTFKISDDALTSLLLCIKQFMWILGNVVCANSLTVFANDIPKTLVSLRKWTGVLRDDFLQYAVCPKCMTVYMRTETYEPIRDGTKVCKTCGHIPFYNHPQQKSALRNKCGSSLLRKEKSSYAKEHVNPIVKSVSINPPSTPLGPDPQVSASPQTEDKVLTALCGLSDQLNEHAADINERFTQLLNSVNSIEEKVAALESNDCAGETYSKRRRRVHNPKLAEAVRRLHNSKTNPRRYEPEQGLISPHNEAVTSYLLKAVSESHDLHNVDKDRIVSACKTYYETVRRSFIYAKPENSSRAEAAKSSARSRARRKRLLESRQSVLAEDEVELWKSATVDLMSDEEEGVVDGVSGWIVRSPSFRKPELSELCAKLQSRLDETRKYRTTHINRLCYGPPSDRKPPVTYDPECANGQVTEL